MKTSLSNAITTLALSSSALFAGEALATVITFDATVAGTSVTSYAEAGFNVSFTGGDGTGYHGTTGYCGPSCADGGSNWMGSFGSFGWANKIIIKAADGHAFSVSSFAGAEGPYSGSVSSSWASGIRVTGVKLDTTTVSQNFTLDQFNDGTGGGADFQNFTASFFDIFTELQFEGIGNDIFTRDFIIDNVTIDETSIPEPTSLALLGVGLAGLAFSRRKTAKQI